MPETPTPTVFCRILNRQAEALGAPPYPGELGRRIVENISREGWARWLERLVTIINENGLNTADPDTQELIEKHMRGFLFDEGDYGQLPPGYHAAAPPPGR